MSFKKLVCQLLTLCLMLVIFPSMSFADVAPDHGNPSLVKKHAEYPTYGVVRLHGISKVFTAYHQLAAIAVEYEGNITAPAFDPANPPYTIRDYAAPYMREEYDRGNGVYSEAKITAIYSNSKPAMRSDKKSVGGKYVIIEIAQIKEVEPYSGEFGYHPVHNAVIATWRQLNPAAGIDDTCTRFRKDFRDVEIIQHVDVRNGGNTAIVSSAGKLPDLLYEDLANIEIDEFVHSSITTQLYKSQARFSYYLPKGYNPNNKNKKYPVVVFVTGNSGRLEFSNGAVMGDEPENIGGQLGRDRMSVRWLTENEDVIVVAPQTSRVNVPYKYDAVDEISSIIDYFLAEYNVNPDRVYAIGSSAGTSQLNSYLKTNASKIAGFISCNGFVFPGVPSNFVPPYSGRLWGYTKEQVLSWVPGTPQHVNDATFQANLEKARVAFSEVVKNRVPMWYYQAVNDQELPVTGSVTNYEDLRYMYKNDLGLSDADIDKLVKLVLYDDPEMLEEGIVEFHGAVNKAAVDPDLSQELLKLNRTDQY